MTQARKNQIDLDSTPYYHCISRCVRRAYLCGKDQYTGICYDHRKPWLLNRMASLTNAFAINVTAYSVMSNHYHVILYVDREKALTWSTEETIRRWLLIYRGNRLVQRFHRKEVLTQSEMETIKLMAADYRKQLYSISTFMACLNQKIACAANQEDNCRGRFWEGRFKSQALLDETALLTCMMYVDLNPIRAGSCQTLEGSDFTSIQQRLLQHAKLLSEKRASTADSENIQPNIMKNDTSESAKKYELPILQPFLDDQKIDNTQSKQVPFKFTDYLQLIDWTGRIIREGKKGAIPDSTTPILEKLRIKPEAIVDTIQSYQKLFKYAVGPIEKMKQYANNLNKKWLFGYSGSQILYSI